MTIDELEERLQKADPEITLRKSETQRSDNYYGTEKLLQVITALIPAELWPKPEEMADLPGRGTARSRAI